MTYRNASYRVACSIYIYTMGWLRLVGPLELYVSFAKEPYKRDDVLQKRPMILRSLRIVGSPYRAAKTHRMPDLYRLFSAKEPYD